MWTASSCALDWLVPHIHRFLIAERHTDSLEAVQKLGCCLWKLSDVTSLETLTLETPSWEPFLWKPSLKPFPFWKSSLESVSLETFCLKLNVLDCLLECPALNSGSTVRSLAGRAVAGNGHLSNLAEAGAR